MPESEFNWVALLIVVVALAIPIVRLVSWFRRRHNFAVRSRARQAAPRRCPQCGTTLAPDVPEGLCPVCLLKHGVATEPGEPDRPPFIPPALAELAKLFPHLEILEPIGKGGMGAVYKARQPSLDRLVALKILAPRSGGDRDFGSRFSREARALARLSHPNIVGVYDFGQAGGLSYFIMEYVDGPNLRQVQQAGKLAPREALEIIPQICAALQFAHDEGIVHRDIKPENVLLDKKGRVKIADFGLARIVGQEPDDFRLTGAKDVVGTPHYMAPEQVETPQEVDHRADIYSLGVVFYEMLTGELPLGKFQPPSAKVQVDVRLDEVVLRALAKEPDRRYQQVSEVRTQVETIARTPGRETQPAVRAAATPGGSLGWLAAIAIVALIVLAGFLVIPNLISTRRNWIPAAVLEPAAEARARSEAALLPVLNETPPKPAPDVPDPEATPKTPAVEETVIMTELNAALREAKGLPDPKGILPPDPSSNISDTLPVAGPVFFAPTNAAFTVVPEFGKPGEFVKRPIRPPLSEEQQRELQDRYAAGMGITFAKDRDLVIGKVAMDAARAGDAALAKQALSNVVRFAIRDEVALIIVRDLAMDGRMADAVEIAKGITSMAQRDKILKTLAEYKPGVQTPQSSNSSP